MVYCDHCGAANDIMNQHCHRCGQALAPAEDVAASVSSLEMAASSVRAIHNQQPKAATDIGAGLELPEWLRRAAAATPEAEPQPGAINQGPPPGFRVAESALPRQPLTAPQSSPANGTSSPVPDWLMTGQTPPKQPPAARAAGGEMLDAASFISETDLPEWIRQIAAADAAKQAEDERIAAETARVTEDESPRRIAFPGETPAGGPATNPWLTRKESAGSADAWSGSAAVEPPAAIVPVEGTVEEAGFETPAAQPASSSKRALPSVKLPNLAKPSLPQMKLRMPSDTATNPMVRYALIAAIVFLLAIIVLMVL